jgi:hypothetical protein
MWHRRARATVLQLDQDLVFEIDMLMVGTIMVGSY